jgi:dihydropteroate synthase-like protein
MKILIVTGTMASELVKKVSYNTNHTVEVYTIDIHIAAFLTPQRIIQEISEISEQDMNEFELIITPGLIRKDVKPVEIATGVPTYKGPKDAADLGVILELIEELDLSSKVPADKLIEEELKARAIESIQNFEKDIKNKKKLLEKPENILIGNLAVGEDFPMRVLAEIANAPLLSEEELLWKAKYYVNSGADMVDLGMLAGETLTSKIPDMVTLLKNNLDVPVSIDTLNPEEIRVAVEFGVDMVLSLDHGNYEELMPLLAEKDVPAVILPTNFSRNFVPSTWEEKVSSLEELARKCYDINIIADPVLDPVNSESIVDSILACRSFKQNNQLPLFWGVGNVTELIDADSVGVNALLAGIAMELGASILFTPEESGKTKGSVRELKISSQMMFLSKIRGSVPKDLGIDLLVFKDKRKGENIFESIKIHETPGKANYKFEQDPQGSFKIEVMEDSIRTIHYVNQQPVKVITGTIAKSIYDTILELGLVSKLDHAAYLGSELQKAEEALILGKNYVQDFPIFKKFWDIEE